MLCSILHRVMKTWTGCEMHFGVGVLLESGDEVLCNTHKELLMIMLLQLHVKR